jgi:predicted permease
VENLFIVPLVYILADFEKSSGSGSLVPTLLAIAKNLLKNPIIIAMLAGLFWFEWRHSAHGFRES